jgi:hypothetical protein
LLRSKYRIIFETKYTALPFPIRITSSGIYGVEDFNIENNRIEFTTYDREHVTLSPPQKKATQLPIAHSSGF